MKRSILRAAADGFINGIQSDSGPQHIHRRGEQVVIETQTTRMIGFVENVDIPGETVRVVVEKQYHKRE